jgi:hypothetical protein
MAIAAPKGRTPLSADALFRVVRRGFTTIPDHRGGETAMSVTEALMAAFAMCSLKSPSRLACDKERAEGHWAPIYGIARVPCDTPMRELLDPVCPASLRPLFKGVFRPLQRGKALEALGFFDDGSLLALDGTGYLASKTIHCASCLHQGHRNGSTTYAHQRLGAAMIHPDLRAVIPLMPEPIVQPDGTDNNDGERHAAKRFMAQLRQDHPHLKCIVTEDRLSANAPHIETLQDYGLHYILGVKDGDHAYLFEQVQAAAHAGRVTYDERHDRAAGVVHRFRLVNDMPLNASNADVRVNFIEYGEIGNNKVQHLSGVTDLRVRKRNVSHLRRGGRARWKIDNETCNPLKNQGYHFEHHDGHGQQHLSVVCATVMMLAFLVDQTQQLCGALFQAGWAKLGSKRLLWERRRAWLYDEAFASMRQRFEALFYGFQKSSPIVTIDSLSSASMFSATACQRIRCSPTWGGAAPP